MINPGGDPAMSATPSACYTCREGAGEGRLSPGPTIHDGAAWRVEHAYPCGMVGWLVIVLKRHAAALHELTPAEWAELAEAEGRAVAVLRRLLACEKEYLVSFAEAEHFQHVHVHVIARAAGLDPALRGPGIFALLKPSAAVAPPEAVAAFCRRCQAEFAA
jgi:diadenosine tetraphosphate (Ap4A) HIT family hydrolase